MSTESQVSFKIPSIFLCALLVLSSTTIFAEDFSYSYIEATYSSSTDDSFSPEIKLNETGLHASIEVSENAAFFVGYFSGSFKDYEIDTTQVDFGVTFHAPIADQMDGALQVAIIKVDIDVPPPFIDEDDTGFGLSLGIRHALGDQLEFIAGFSHTNLFDASTNKVGIGFLFKLSSSLGLRASFSTGDDVDSFTGGVRASF